MIRLLFTMFALVVFCQPAILAHDISLIKKNNGIRLVNNNQKSGVWKSIELEVVTDKIIRVVVMPENGIPSSSSLMTSYVIRNDLNWTTSSTKQKSILRTKSLIVEVDNNTGTVSFFDKNHNRIVSERQEAGRSFEPVVSEGYSSYKISQSFTTTQGEGWYGLGQHQQGIMNYKGQQVTFFQNNTEVSIPFLVSSRNYGILWDNYSLTKAGVEAPFFPLSSLQLFSKRGEKGWLTATYSNDRARPQDKHIELAESEINMPFLGDSKKKLPKDFKPGEGIVTWEGSMASPFTGTHQLKLIMGGTLRIWVDNQLLLNRWRKSWNPAQVIIPLHLTKNTKVPVRIEWEPEGGESYLSFEWQRPLTPQEKKTFTFCSDNGRQIDYYLVYGSNLDSVISGYRYITGKAPIVPKWALGFWQSRERYKTQNEILSVMEEFRKRKIPIDNIVLDWSYWKEAEWGSQEFDESRFPSPDSMIDVLHKEHKANIMISVWPKFYEGIPAYKDFERNNWLYKRNIADRQRDWIGEGYVSTFYDAFNQEARSAFWDLLNRKLFSKGIDAWWMDASEPDIVSNVSPAKRIEQVTPNALGSGSEFLNAYPLLNAKGIYDGQRSTNPMQRVFLLTRSAYAGSQRYAAAVWSGDIGSTWEDMRNQISAGLNYSMSGLPYWTMDIGGFVVPGKFEKPDTESLEEWRELNARWYQFGAFVPLFRSHGQFPYREIFNIAPEDHAAYRSFLYFNKLRYRLLPYTYSLAAAAFHDDYTIMRGLPMDFGNDSAVLSINDQYMFGRAFLVNPVYQYKQRSREVYLPVCAGWYDFYTGKFYKGGQKIMAEASYEEIPLYVKAGSIIPYGPDLQYTSERVADTISLHIYSGANGSFKLYEDEGTNYNYEAGKYTSIKIDWDETRQLLTIGKRQGSYDGMIKHRVFLVKKISPSTRADAVKDAGIRRIEYHGAEISITGL